jgi:hypothetical protein
MHFGKGLLVTYPKSQRFLRLYFASIVDSSGGNIGVSKPFLYFSDVGLMI